MGIAIEPLGKQHKRAEFGCGQVELDAWFHRQASQDDRRNIARVFVATDDALGVIGFYSLGSFTLTLENVPENIARKLPRYDLIPAALIGRLARDIRARGQGVGEFLLADAVRRILAASKTVAIFAIVVDAKDARAMEFYAGFGFRSFPQQPNRMFLLASTASAAIQKM